MPDSSREDQLNTSVLSGEGPGCTAVLVTYKKYIRMCWHRVCCRGRGAMVPTIIYWHILIWTCHLSTVWHFEWLQEGSGGGGIYSITGGLRTQHAKSPAGVCQTELSMYVRVGGNKRERQCNCMCLCFYCGLPEFTPSLNPVFFIAVVSYALYSQAHTH